MSLKHILSGVFISCLLTACAGSGGTTVAEGGIGGSGISVGPITAFGSVWVNGVRYDVSGAEFVRDGVMVSGQGEYRIGEIVTVSGSVNTDRVTGKADRVVFNDALEGTVTSVSSAANELQVLGQRVKVSSLTIFHGFALLADLQPGNVVEISGSPDSQGVINASSITLKQSNFVSGVSELEIKGRVESVNASAQTFVLNSIRVDYSTAQLDLPGNQPVNGQYVEVKSMQPLQNNLLIAAKIELKDEQIMFAEGVELELEGRITLFRSSQDFAVNGVPVLTTTDTEFEYGTAADLKLDSVVEVEGIINASGVLLADEIAIRQSADAAEEVELEGSVSAIDAAKQELTLLGNTVVVDNQTILLDETSDRERSIRFTDLRVGNYLEVSGKMLADGRILALKLSREDSEDGHLEVKGVCRDVNVSEGTLVIQGVTVMTDGNTEFESDDESLNQQQFFSRLVEGETIVGAEGTALGNNWIRAVKMEAD